MKIHIILFCCLCSGLAVTVDYETTGSTNAKGSLTDIRQVPVKNAGFAMEQSEFLKQITTTVEPTAIRQSLRKSRGENKQFDLTPKTRIGNSQADSLNNQAQMQKIANQLYLAQKRASLLSDYQKFILNQDPNVKNFVLGQSPQKRNFTQISPKRPSGRSYSTHQKVKYNKPELPEADSIDLGKILVVTPKAEPAVEKISKPQNDFKAQETHVKYVTLSPQPLTHYIKTHEPGQRVTLLNYYKPQPFTYYDVGATSKPQVETVEIPTTASLALGSYKVLQPQYHSDEVSHEDSVKYDNAKYEFVYKVKDNERNNYFGHKESRSDKTTYGYYFVHLPDGRLETVQYWADKSGYHAKVHYQGQAKHPTNSGHRLNSYNLD